MTELVASGDILAGKYRVERVLGRGGMGLVVAATHLQLAQRVALKFLIPEALRADGALERFQREARAAVQFRGEHVARVMDVGTLESGAPFIVMEYLEGADLSAVLQSRGPLPVEEAVDYMLQACEALAEAHGLGIVHRDLKPANLFLTRAPDGSALIKVLDFGISKVLGSQSLAISGGITATSAVMGSPLYMSPEQITSSREVDHRTDIWAMGVILHELLAGVPPFRADTAPALMVAIAVAVPPPLRAERPDAPPELEAIVACCLSKDRSQRFGNVAELSQALAPFASSAGRSSVQRILRMLGMGSTELAHSSGTARVSLPGAVAEQGTLDAWGHTQLRSTRSRVGLWGGALVAGICLVGAAMGVMHLTRSSPSGVASGEPVTSAAASSSTQPSSSARAAEKPRVEPTGMSPIGTLGATPRDSALPATEREPERPTLPRAKPEKRAVPVGVRSKPAASAAPRSSGWREVFDDID